jgi:hypothetical protein
MTSAPSASSVVRAKPQPNIYTVLLMVGVVVLLATLVVVLYTLMSAMPKGYGMDFGDLLAPLK